MWVARQQMLVCSANCSSAVDLVFGIVSQEMPVGAAIRLAGLMYGDAEQSPSGGLRAAHLETPPANPLVASAVPLDVSLTD